jgi:general secretion pathway protein N
LFSPTRKPSDQTTGGRPADEALSNLRLTGIVIESDRHLAIFAVPNAKPLVRSEGETVDDWKLESIGPRQVSLSGPTGVTTLEPKTDPNIIRPAAPQPAAPQPAAAPAQPAAAPVQAAAAPGQPLPGPGRPVALGRPSLPAGPQAAGRPFRSPPASPGAAGGPVPPTQ